MEGAGRGALLSPGPAAGTGEPAAAPEAGVAQTTCPRESTCDEIRLGNLLPNIFWWRVRGQTLADEIHRLPHLLAPLVGKDGLGEIMSRRPEGPTFSAAARYERMVIMLCVTLWEGT